MRSVLVRCSIWLDSYTPSFWGVGMTFLIDYTAGISHKHRNNAGNVNTNRTNNSALATSRLLKYSSIPGNDGAIVAPAITFRVFVSNSVSFNKWSTPGQVSSASSFSNSFDLGKIDPQCDRDLFWRQSQTQEIKNRLLLLLLSLR